MKEFLLRLVYAVVLVGGGVWLSAWARTVLRHALDRFGVDPLVASVLARMVRPVLIVLAVVAGLGVLGFDEAAVSLAAVLGGSSIAIGMGLKGYLSDVAAGAFLLTNRPFDRGDSVNVGGQAGTVRDLGLFTTRLDLADGNTVFVPNHKVTSAPIHNFTDRGTRRVEVVVDIARDADLEAMRDKGLALLAALPAGMDEPGATATLVEVGAIASQLALRVWVPNAAYGGTLTTLREAAHGAFPPVHGAVIRLQ